MVSKVNWTLANPILRARAITKDLKVSGIMARYGSQHLLPIEHLKAKGLQTMLYDENGLLRFFSPWEFLSALGFPVAVVTSSDLAVAFQQSGNAISPVHAWLQICKTHTVLGHLSIFSDDFSPADMLRGIMDRRIKLSQCMPVKVGRFVSLQPYEETCEESPQSKRPRCHEGDSSAVAAFPCTVPFQIEGNNENEMVTIQEPKFVIDTMEASAKHAFCKGGLMFFKHELSHWLMTIHGGVDEKLGNLIMRALPHARDEMFESFTWGKRMILWDDVVTCAPPATVSFRPCPFVITCMLEDGQVLKINGDVTWTMQTVSACVASRIRCNIDTLRFLFEGIPTKPCDFAAEFPTRTFEVKFQACTPGYASISQHEDLIADMGMIPAHDGVCRYVTKHPGRKTLRTACLPHSATVAEVIRKLLPDLACSVTWTVHENGTPFSPDDCANEKPCFEIEWDCFKPLAPTMVCLSTFHLPADSIQLQMKSHASPQRWVKSPFKTKAQILRMNEEVSLMEIAASFVSHAQLDINMTCHVGSRLVDPSILVKDVPVQDVISFKIAPLVGGAKRSNQDAMKTRIVKALEMHGVAKEASTDRAASLLLKADVETLSKFEGCDDEEFWKELKSEANRVHFRLVFRNEMQQAKKEGRKKPPAKQAKKGKTNGPSDAFVPNSTNVVIDVKHFWDGDVNIDMIEQSRFGPDQKGLTVMSVEEANRHSHTGPISIDALAILVVGRRFGVSDIPFSMPAHTVKGEPIVIQAALRQFGDREVTFKAAVPVSQVDSMASTVVELHIMRSEVSSWKECSVPLHYLGVHVSAVRGSSLIATWSFKTWQEPRTPSPFKEAQYWHGYIRVPDDILDQVLVRSGHAGIYLSPKDMSRRHDDRFAVIALPDCSLQDALKKAGSLERGLGVVKLRDQLGIRCRREHASALRAALLPESAFVADEGIGASDNVWILKNIPCEVGKEGLQTALTQSGWNAKPIRAQGHDRWIVAANDEPPYKHMLINGSFVLVEAIRKQRDGNAISITAKQVRVDTLLNPSNNGIQIAQTTRIQEVKAEISDHFEQKLQAANDRIAQLSTALEQFQSVQLAKDTETKNELAMVRQEQAFAKQKIGEVEASVVQSGQTVITTMQNMMTQMQSNLENSMKQFMAGATTPDDCKRPRNDQGVKTDSFSTKA
eukprot:s604_g17.t1